MRSSQNRAHQQLVDLAVLNERLAGGNGYPWEARKRLEYLQSRRQQWEAVYEYITKTDAAATLASIEEAFQKVRMCSPSPAPWSASRLRHDTLRKPSHMVWQRFLRESCKAARLGGDWCRCETLSLLRLQLI